MKTTAQKTLSKRLVLRSAAALTAVLLSGVIAGCGSMGMGMGGGMSPVGKVSLSGADEVPANPSKATGSGVIKVGTDHSVSGSVSTTGIDGKMAHIHLAAKGSNGPVIVPLTKTADSTWSVPDGTKLNDAQYAAYVAGNLYVNVHSAALPGGEIRGQVPSN